MKLAHIVAVTPRRCGLYETTRELVAAERAIGIDARMYDSRTDQRLHPGGTEDRGAWFCDLAWTKQADVLINHSGLGHELETRCTLPVVHVAHGRPLSSFLSEMNKQAPVYSYHYGKNKDARYKCVVTFWPEHIPYLEVMWRDTPVHGVPPPVDLQFWTPTGPNGYKFHGMGSETNVVVTDANRDDVIPFSVVNAFAVYANQHPLAKLHIYTFQSDERGWPALLKSIQDRGNLGECKTWLASGLDHVYRSTSMLITPHKIYTRSIREAMACGCPVVSGRDCDPDDIVEFANRMIAVKKNRLLWRDDAETMFDPKNSARAMLEVVNGCG